MRVLCFLAASLVLSGCASSMPPLTQAGLLTSSGALGAEAAPLDFSVKRYPGGEPYALSEDRGSVVLLDVWATWCEPCRDALPMYQDLAKHYGERGLKVYALNVDEDARAVPAFLSEAKVTLPVLLDAQALVAETVLRVRTMPTTVLVDRQGRVRYVHEGFSEEFLMKYQNEIEELLSER
ncbi:MAG: TlpA disulfide reductase family protein [Cystobacter sp.]